jgi:competence transcription factor ComK
MIGQIVVSSAPTNYNAQQQINWIEMSHLWKLQIKKKAVMFSCGNFYRVYISLNIIFFCSKGFSWRNTKFQKLSLLFSSEHYTVAQSELYTFW